MANFIKNICRSMSINGEIPFEVWHGRKLTNKDLKYFRTFGCEAWAAIISPRKLGETSQKCIYLGLDEGVKGCRLWRLADRKIICSRDVRFYEDIFPCQGRNKEEVQAEDEKPRRRPLDIVNSETSSSENEEDDEGKPENENPNVEEEREEIQVPGEAQQIPEVRDDTPRRVADTPGEVSRRDDDAILRRRDNSSAREEERRGRRGERRRTRDKGTSILKEERRRRRDAERRKVQDEEDSGNRDAGVSSSILEATAGASDQRVLEEEKIRGKTKEKKSK